MDEEIKKHWFKENIEKYKEELVKLSKITKLNLELAGLNRKKNMKLKNLGKRAFALVEEGAIDKEIMGNDYIDLVNILDNIEQIKQIIDDLKKQQEIEVLKDMPEQPLDDTDRENNRIISNNKTEVIKKENDNEEFKS
jgi:hypothetical protein